MTGSLLVRGMITGLLAGLLAFAFASVFGEPQVEQAVAFEQRTSVGEAAIAAFAAGQGAAMDHAAAPAAELVSRSTQATWGLATGLLTFGTAIGGLFSLVFAYGYGRIGALGARATSGLLAAFAFVSIAVVPLLKYPANPPAVGSDDTIAARTSLFFAILVVSVLAMVVAVMIARALWSARGGWTAATAGALAYVVLVGAAMTILPAIDEMPDGFSAQVIWNFRVSVLGIHLVLWSVIGLGFGILAERSLEPGGTRRTAYG